MTGKARATAQACGMLAALLVVVLTAAALAQSPGTAAKPNSTIPEKQHMGPVRPPATSDGVIAPKADTDPAMTKRPPPQNPNETPVIPPPKATGGAPQ